MGRREQFDEGHGPKPVMDKVRKRWDLFDHIEGPDHPEVYEPSDSSYAYLKALHDSLHWDTGNADHTHG